MEFNRNWRVGKRRAAREERGSSSKKAKEVALEREASLRRATEAATNALRETRELQASLRGQEAGGDEPSAPEAEAVSLGTAGDGPPPCSADNNVDDGGARQARACLTLCERLSPHERRLVYLSPDSKEAHYIVAARRQSTYHTSYRDMVFVGFRRVPCSDGSVLMGWCNSDECEEAPHRRAFLPEADCSHCDVAKLTSKCHGQFCKCAKKLIDVIGESNLDLTLHTDKKSLPKGDPPIASMGWKVGGFTYHMVNANEEHKHVFGQWGASRMIGPHQFHCTVCQSTPRHCPHNQMCKRILQGRAPVDPTSTRRGRDLAEESILEALTDDRKELKIPCISRDRLPFFRDEDEIVRAHCEGKSRLYVITFELSLYATRTSGDGLPVETVSRLNVTVDTRVVTAFNKHGFKLPDIVAPTWTCCPNPDCKSTSPPAENTKVDMEVFSSTGVLHCKYVSLRCVDCNTVAMADGKEHGMLVLYPKVCVASKLKTPPISSSVAPNKLIATYCCVSPIARVLARITVQVAVSLRGHGRRVPLVLAQHNRILRYESIARPRAEILQPHEDELHTGCQMLH